MAAAFLLNMTHPTVVINGMPYELRWNAPASFPVTPGYHWVQIFFRYMGSNAGNSAVQAYAADGGVVQVRYTAPAVVTQNGAIALYS